VPQIGVPARLLSANGLLDLLFMGKITREIAYGCTCNSMSAVVARNDEGDEI
jgi:hypothetical protein